MGWVLPEVQIRGPVEFGFLCQKFRFLSRILRLNETGLTFSSFGFGQVTTFRFQFEKLSKSGIHLRLFVPYGYRSSNRSGLNFTWKMDKISKNILTKKNPQFLFDFILAIEVFWREKKNWFIKFVNTQFCSNLVP